MGYIDIKKLMNGEIYVRQTAFGEQFIRVKGESVCLGATPECDALETMFVQHLICDNWTPIDEYFVFTDLMKEVIKMVRDNDGELVFTFSNGADYRQFMKAVEHYGIHVHPSIAPHPAVSYYSHIAMKGDVVRYINPEYPRHNEVVMIDVSVGKSHYIKSLGGAK